MSSHLDKTNPDYGAAAKPMPLPDHGVKQLLDRPGFGTVPEASGSALYRHPGEGRLFGLSYDIRPDTAYAGGHENTEAPWRRLAIEAWTYGVQDDALSLPVMGFVFRPGGADGPLHCRVGDLKIMSRPMAADTHTGARALSVALFFINQINAGQVPNCEKILKLHGLYPSSSGQAPFQDADSVRGD